MGFIELPPKLRVLPRQLRSPITLGAEKIEDLLGRLPGRVMHDPRPDTATGRAGRASEGAENAHLEIVDHAHLQASFAYNRR
ncbi:hypothetical protein [Jiella sp. M17.18]|uniref:hypothetical protein n=1 Tax=Jiella sp. M17.18 TaxID=3234247 RepID=UPI0034DFD4B3